MSTSDLDDLAQRVAENLRSREITYVDTKPATQPKYSSYHQAAAVLSTYDSATLSPVYPTNDAWSIEDVLADSTTLKDAARQTRWTLERSVRQDVLRQLKTRENMLRALNANPNRAYDKTQEMFEAYLRGNAPALKLQDASQVAGTFEVSDWLNGILDGVPSLDQVRERFEFISLLQPFELIAGKHFRGRTKELQTLRDYVGILPPGTLGGWLTRSVQEIFDWKKKPPLMIYGPGGRGKSALVARFILEHANLPDTEKFPWAYLDFDRAVLQPDEPLTLLMETIRQLGVQYPQARTHCDRIYNRWQQELLQRAERLRQTTKPRKNLKQRVQKLASPLSGPQEWDRYLSDLTNLINQLKVERAPFLLVLDTFEVIQYRGEVIVGALLQFLQLFQKHVPRLRTVLAGRAALNDSPDFQNFPIQLLPLGNFDRGAAQGFLETNGVPSDTAQVMASRVSGNPLNLKLALDLRRGWQKNESDSKMLDSFRFLEGLNDAEQQGLLFGRILSRISSDDEKVSSEDVRRIAHPGLVLRRVTPELIEEVLAVPCGVSLKTTNYARLIFDQLKRQVSLVRVETLNGQETLVHREDVRREMLRLLRYEHEAQVRSIHEAAVAFYEKQQGAFARAEEVYHRLVLKQPPEILQSRWLDDLEFKQYLYSALDEYELEIHERAWLAPRLGRPLSSNERALADLQEWERDTAPRVRDLLLRRQFDAALTTLHERFERTPGSPLYGLEIQALELQAQWQAASAVIEQGIQSALNANDRLLAADLTLRSANVQLQLKDFSAAQAALAEAEQLGQTDNPLPQRQIAFKLTRLDLNRFGMQKEVQTASLKRELAELFNALPDEQVLADAFLMQQISFYLMDDSQILGRIVSLNGLGTSRQTSLRRLARELVLWDNDLSTRADETAGILARRFALPLADTLTETWTRFVLAAEPKSLGQVAAYVLDNNPPSSLVKAIQLVLNENLAFILIDQNVEKVEGEIVGVKVGALGGGEIEKSHEVDKAGGQILGAQLDKLGSESSVGQIKGGINISGDGVSIGGDFVGGDKFVQGDEFVQGDQNTVIIGEGAQVGLNESTANYLGQGLVLNGQQKQQLVDALLSAVPSRAAFAQMVHFRLDVEMESIALTDNLSNAVTGVVDYLQRHGEIVRLIAAVRDAYPENVKLLQFAAQFGLAPSAAARPSQSISKETNLDPQVWLARLGEYEPRVCRVELNNEGTLMYGTAFLVGPDLILTTYHLVQSLIGQESAPRDVAFRFDYKKLQDGETINSGTSFRLGADWLVDFSPYSASDTNESNKELPTMEGLDYALLRLGGAPGANPIGGERAEYTSKARGWIEVPAKPMPGEPKRPLLLFHYPSGNPIKFSFETGGIIGYNANGTRLLHRVPTELGSAGAPCFDNNWNLIAMHQGKKDVSWSMRGQPTNQAISISAILELMELRGKKHLLYQSMP